MKKRIIIVGIEAYGNSDRSLALDNLSGALRMHSPHIVKTINSARHSLEQVAKTIQSFNPSIICLSVRPGGISYLENLNKIISLSTYRGTVVFGGLTASASPDILLSKYPKSIIVIGEGEEAIVDISLKYNGMIDNLREIPNLVYLNNGKLISTEKRVVTDKYITISYDDAIEAINSGGVCWIESSRSCSFKCSFCSCRLSHFNSGWRPLPLKHIVEQLKFFTSKNVGIVSFADLNTFENIERLVEIADAIEEKPKSLCIRFDIRADSIYNPRDSIYERKVRHELLQRLKSNGLVQVFIGYESCDGSKLHRFHKDTNPTIQNMALKVLNEIGIDYVLGYILFDPEMSFEELIPNLNYVIGNNLLRHISTPLKQLRVQRGTPLETKMKQKGLLRDLQDNLIYYNYDYQDSRLTLISNIASYFYFTTAKVYRHSYITNMLQSMNAAPNLQNKFESFSYRYKILETNLIYDMVDCYQRNNPEKYLIDIVNKYVKLRIDMFFKLSSFYQALIEDGFQYFQSDMKTFCDYLSRPSECDLIGVDPADIIGGNINISF